jgi:hypothetical protein
MSGPAGLDLSEQIARVARRQEEARKFAAEQHKLMAEAAKLNRDRHLAPSLAVVAVIGDVLGRASFLAKVM